MTETEAAKTGRGGGTGAGRPGHGRTEQLPPVRCTLELKEALTAIADAHGRRLTDEIREVLERHVADHRPG
jgi:hypothetical protein